VFHQDGTLEVDVNLTGIMLAKGTAATKVGGGHDPHHGHLVAPHVMAPHHQHFFNFRLDLDVDGTGNSAFEMNTRAVPDGPQNPHGNAIVMEDVPLRTEKQAMRDVDMKASRTWRIEQPRSTTSLGYHPGFVLLPTGNAVPYLTPASPVRARARFLDHHVWITRFHPDELHAAGWYPNQGRPGEGLIRYVADDEALEGQDLVLWYTLGVTHIPRPEEWPVMTIHRAGFKLLPAAFFEENPALDVGR
jgi:primary-amine oxidase